jgi:fluoroacetyl-CoA thioesterase
MTASSGVDAAAITAEGSFESCGKLPKETLYQRLALNLAADEKMKATLNIPVGAAASESIVVTREMTVAHFHPHMPEVYGTPMMIYLMELAAAEAIQEYLPAGWVSVGVLVNVRHLAATPVGFTVRARAEVISVEGKTVTFSVEAHDDNGKIGEGTHVRAPVHLERFNERAKLKLA